MNYQTRFLQSADLVNIVISRQDEIIRQTGLPLVPKQALDAIRIASQDYSISDQNALKADALFVRLLAKNGIAVPVIPVPKSSPSDSEPTKQEYADALDSLRAMLDLVEGDEWQDYTDAIDALEIIYDLF